MAAGSFQQDSPAWQLQQLRRQITEWIELKLSGGASSGEPPDPWTPPTVPEWLERLVLGVILAVFLAALLWRLWQVLQTVWLHRRSWLKWRDRNPTVRFDSSSKSVNWLHQAQLAQQQGHYSEACRALYLAMLKNLDDAQVIPHHASRTNGEYLQLVQQLPRSRAYQVLIQTHERICFGKAVVSAEVFQRCQRAYQEIDKP